MSPFQPSEALVETIRNSRMKVPPKLEIAFKEQGGTEAEWQERATFNAQTIIDAIEECLVCCAGRIAFKHSEEPATVAVSLSQNEVFVPDVAAHISNLLEIRKSGVEAVLKTIHDEMMKWSEETEGIVMIGEWEGNQKWQLKAGNQNSLILVVDVPSFRDLATPGFCELQWTTTSTNGDDKKNL